MTLASFNAAPEQEAVSAMLACCASHRFAAAMAAGRPYPSRAAALDASNCPLFTFAGNPTGSPGNNSYPPTPTYNYVTRQLSGCFATASSTTTTTTAAKRRAAAQMRKKHKHRRHKRHARARRLSRPPRRSVGFTG